MKPLAILAISFVLNGCASICVNRVDTVGTHERGPVGQRFSLPVPAFLVTPTGEGGMKVERNDLPDPANTFAIDGWALFAKYSLNVETKSGILSEVKWAPDTSAVLSQAIGSAQGAASEIVKAKQTTATAKTTAIESAESDVVQARRAWEAMKAEFGADSDKAKEAKIALEKAKAKLAYLKGELTVDGAENGPLSSAANDPTSMATLEERGKTAPSPMLLVLRFDEEGRPSLEPASYEGGRTQIRVPIAGTKPSTTPSAPAAIALAKADEFIDVIKPAGGPIVVEMELTAAVKKNPVILRLESITTLEAHTERVVSLATKEDDSTKLVLTLQSSLPKDKYRFKFEVEPQANGDAMELKAKIDVQ